MSELAELKGAVATVRRIVAGLEPGRVRGDDSVVWLAQFTEGERVLAAGRMLMAKRVEESNVWRQSGERSAAHFLAHKTGTTVGHAQAGLETAERLAELPATAEAFRAGKLSETQAEAVASAAVVSPGEEQRLLDKAKGTVKQLKDECRRVRHAATDERARYDKIKRERSLRTWTDDEGAFCGAFRTTPDAGARMLAALDAEIERVFKVARTEGRREPHQAYAVDALEALLCSGGSGKRSRQTYEIGVLVDWSAMVRGHTEAGEVCELEGLGPVPVSVVESWRNDAYLRLIVTDGVDVKAISRRSRYIDSHQHAALKARDRKCIITNCDVTWRLQRDHHVPFAEGGPTCLANLHWLCAFHHALKTKGWLLVGGPGCCRLVPPGTDTGDAGREQDRAPPARC